MKTVSNYALRLPASLKREIERTAAADGTTINQFIVSAAAEKLSALRTADYFTARAARADLAAFDRIMFRSGGQPPAPGDEIKAKPRSSRRRKRGAVKR
jgi:uncharacterized protein (DUF1778 family)